MALWNISIDDTSPMLQYASGGYSWQHNTGPSDQWYDGTYNFANSFAPYPPSLQLNFSGSAVTIYGQSNMGFRVTIDDSGPGSVHEPSNNTDILYSNTNLAMGFHTIFFSGSNTSSTADTQLALYLDRFVVGAQVGAQGATLDETIIQSDSPQLKTFGKIESKDVGGNGSTPFAVEQNAGFAFNFTGSAVAVYSPPYGDGVPLRAQYAVYFNSSIPPSATDRMWLVLPGQTNGNGALQFFAAGLPEGEHRVALVNLLGGGQAFGFDYAQVITPSEYLPPTDALCYYNCSNATGVQTGPGYTPEQQWSVTPQSGAGRSATLGAVASGAGALLVCLALF